MATNQLQQLLDAFESRLTAVEGALGTSKGSSGPPAGAAASNSSAADAAFVTAYDNYCANNLDPFVAVCEKLGGGAAKGGAIVKKAWAAQRDFLVMASKCKKPDQATLISKLQPVQACMKEAGSSIARDEWELHGKTISEGLGCLNWVAVAPPAGLPKDIAESAVGGSDYWANKIRVTYKKDGPAEQIEFCDTFKGLLTGLAEYIVGYHKAGVDWYMRGGDVSAYTLTSTSTPSTVPPSPPTSTAAKSASAVGASSSPPNGTSKPAAAGLGNVFGELSKGLDVTKGLKKVTKDQQTWRAEYKGSDAPASTSGVKPSAIAAANAKSASSKAVAPTAPPRLEFLKAGNKWCVEHQTKENGVVTVEVTDTKHSVYIYGCTDATIDVKGKCKSVCIDGCKKSKVLVDDCISSVELVNCQRMQVQIRGAVPSVAIDKTDGFLCYLGAAALDTTFTTSKSSEMNVSFPKPGSADDELMELPIPEQFVHSLAGMAAGTPQITSSVSDLYTH